MEFSIIHLVISVLLFFVLFFGIGFILNMLLRMTWVMAVIYPLVVVLVVDDVRFIDYFRDAGSAFPSLWNNVIHLAPADITILLSGFAGAICSGFTMNILRKQGYRMF
jgi:hypothetical protein